MAVRFSSISVFAPAVGNDLRSAPRIARELGFSGVQVPLAWAGVDLATLSMTGLREVRHVLSGQEQQLVSIQLDLGAKGLGPGADVDRWIDRIDATLQAARSLSAVVVTVDLGQLPEPKREEKPATRISAELAGLILLPQTAAVPAQRTPSVAETVDAKFFSQVDAAMLEIGRRADRASVVLAFRAELSSFIALERTLKTAACPWFGVDLDPVAMLQDELESDDIFSRLGTLVRHVRVRDAVGGTAARTKPVRLGEGDTKWVELFALLEAAGYHGWLSVDPMDLPDRLAAATAALKVLQSARR